jgi:hypothetical protein
MTQYIDESMEKSVTKFVIDEPEPAQEQNTNSNPTSEIVKGVTNGQTGTAPTGLLKEVLDSIEKVNRLAMSELLEPNPLIYYKDHPIFLVNEQTNFSAFTGCYKSTLINFFVACMIKKENNKFDFYEFTPNPKYKDSLVIIADTEQNEGYAVPKRIKRIKKVAGYSKSEVVPRLAVVALRKFGNKMKDATEALLNYYRQLNPDTHIILIIDVVTGFVADFLDSKSNQDFILWINESMAKLNCTIITTIHAIQTDGGATKSKGHTGSLTDNNSSQHFYSGKVKSKFFDEKQVYKFALKKDREGQEKDIFYFCYDPDYFIRVLQDEEIETHGIKVSKRTDQDIINDLHSHFGFKEFRLKNDGELDQKLCFIYDTRNYGTITKKLKELLDKKFKIDKTPYYVKLISRKDPNDSRGKIFQLTQEQPAENLNFGGHD